MSAATVDQLRPHLRDRFPWHDPATVRSGRSAAEWWATLHPMFVAAYTANGLDPALAEAAASRVPAEFYRLDAWTIIDGAEEALRVTKSAGYRKHRPQ